MSSFKRKVTKNKVSACGRCAKPCVEFIGLACIYLGGTVDPNKHQLARIMDGKK